MMGSKFGYAVLAVFIFMFMPGYAYAATDLYGCGNLNSGEYVLQKDLTTSGHCFTIVGDDVKLDGNGHKITISNGHGIHNAANHDRITIENLGIYQSGTSSSVYGIYGNKMEDSLIRDVTIETNGATCYGIYLVNDCDGNVIEGSHITTHGSGSPGIYLITDCNDNIIECNDVTTYNSESPGIYLNNDCDDNVLDGNDITSNEDDSSGIYLRSYCDRNTLMDNVVDVYGCESYGIYLYSPDYGHNCDYNTIFGNTISTREVGNNRYCYGILVLRSDHENISGNIINTDGEECAGIKPMTSSYNYISENIIHTTGKDAYGLYLKESSHYNTLVDNIVYADYDYYGIHILDSDSNNFTSSVFDPSASYGVYLREAYEDNFVRYSGFNHDMVIRYYDVASQFNYGDVLYPGIILKTNVSVADVRLLRDIDAWSGHFLNWSESPSKNVRVGYGFVGLPDAIYALNITKAGVTTSEEIIPGLDGELFFEIVMNSRTQIMLIGDIDSIDIVIESPQNTIYYSDDVWFNVTAVSSFIGMDTCFYSLDGKPNVTMSNHGANHYSRAEPVPDGAHDVIFYCENKRGFVNMTDVVYFSTGSIPPMISIISPLNMTYTYNELFNVTAVSSFSSIAECLYSLDGQPNVTMSNDGVSSFYYHLDGSFGDGSHNIIFYCMDTKGMVNKTEKVYFSKDTIPPVINVISPQNISYNSRTIWFNVTTDEEAGWCGYSLDGMAYVTLDGGGTYWHGYNDSMVEEFHDVVFSCSDIVGNVNFTEPIYFTVDISPLVFVDVHPNPVSSTGIVYFDITCMDMGSGCKETKITTGPYACSVAHTAETYPGSKSYSNTCSFDLSDPCMAGEYMYFVDTEDDFGFHNTSVNGTFEYKMDDGCECVMNEECLNGSCLDNYICVAQLEPVLSFVRNGTSVDIPLGGTGTVVIDIKNPLDHYNVVEISLFGDPSIIDSWMGFVDDGSRRVVVRLEPRSDVAIPVSIFGGKAGSYTLTVFAESEINGLESYDKMTVNVVKSYNGILSSNTPGMGAVCFVIVAMVGALMVRKRV